MMSSTWAIWRVATVALLLGALAAGVVAVAMFRVAADAPTRDRPAFTPAYCDGNIDWLSLTERAQCDAARDLSRVGFTSGVTASVLVAGLLGAALTAWASSSKARADALSLAGDLEATPDRWVVRAAVKPLARELVNHPAETAPEVTDDE